MRLRLNPFVRRAAAEAGTLAAIFGSDTAADEAIQAAISRHDRVVIERIAVKAEAIAAREDNEEFAAALEWFAHQIRKELGPDAASSPYEPHDGDCIQLTLIGDVVQFEVTRPPAFVPETLWEFTTEDGLILPFDPEDFARLDIARLTGEEDE